MLYEIVTLSLRVGGVPAALAGVKADSERGGDAQFLGCWTAEIGELNTLLLLRAYSDAAAMQAERLRLYGDVNPFGAGEAILDMRCEAYAPFPWALAPQPGRYGAIYEFRTYTLKPGGLPATIAGWEAAVPARERFSRLLLPMYALDGAPRFTHIWPYANLEARAKARAEAVAAGIWPPRDGPLWLKEMRSTLAVPAAFSPLA